MAFPRIGAGCAAVFLCVAAASAATVSVHAETPNLPISDRDLGQLLILGFKGTAINEGLSEVIKESKPGAILLFGRNVKSAQQVAEMTYAAQKLSLKVSSRPLLVAIDQEGGNVIRIKHQPPLPSALALGRTGSSRLAQKAGAATGRLLRSLGINMNLAPVVDVADPDKDTFLGTRTFGSDARAVAAISVAVASGLQSSLVLPIAKHFPGHGDASGDSHLMAASSNSTRDDLLARDLVPYTLLAKQLKRPWGAMLAHVAFPNIDASMMPATFSKPIIRDLLRRTVDSALLVITDDIEMAGAGAEANVGLRAVRAIDAGADMVMIAWSRKIQREVLAALRSALETGRLRPERVREALARINDAKRVYASKSPQLASVDELAKALKNPAFYEIGEAVLRALAKRHLARVPAAVPPATSASIPHIDLDQAPELEGGPEEGASEEKPPAYQLNPGADPILVFSARQDFLDGFKRRAKGYRVKTFPIRPSQKEMVERTLRANPQSIAFAYVSGRQVAGFFSDLADDLAARIIIVNVETRASLREPTRFKDVFDVHYRHPRLGEVVAETFLTARSQ